MVTMSKQFVQWLMRWMRHNQIQSGSELARRLGVNRGTVNHWLAGRRTPSHRHIEALSRLTGTPKEDIYRLLERIEPLQSADPDQEARRQRLLYLFGQLDDSGQETLLTVAEGLLRQQERRGKK